MKGEVRDYYAGDANVFDAEVVINGKEIVVSWTEREPKFENVIWRGIEAGEVHWKLERPEVKGRASLHRSTLDEGQLEGSFFQSGHQGMWSVEVTRED